MLKRKENKYLNKILVTQFALSRTTGTTAPAWTGLSQLSTLIIKSYALDVFSSKFKVESFLFIDSSSTRTRFKRKFVYLCIESVSYT